MKTEKELLSLSEQCKEFFRSTPETSVEVKINNEAIELWPAETTLNNAFYLTEKMVDFCRFMDMSSYVYYDEEHGKLIARIF